MKKTNIFKLVLGLMLVFGLVACSGNNGTTDSEAPENDSTGETTTDSAGTSEVTLLRSYQAPHGEKSFARVVVAMDGDKIIDVAMDEFQYFAADSDNEFVPNSDATFGEGSAEDVNLGSKLLNNKTYSANMMEKAEATLTYEENMQAIIDFAKGKTADEIEDVLKDATDGEPMDAVSGATFVDTPGYLKAIVETIKNPVSESKGEADPTAITLKAAQSSGNRDSDINDTVLAMDGDKIVVASIDELYYMEDGEGVPNSDAGFGENYVDPNSPLSSKLVNTKDYSAKMMEIANATLTYDENIQGIEGFLIGKTKADLEDVAKDATPGEPIDAITGATFANGLTYIEAAINAAE